MSLKRLLVVGLLAVPRAAQAEPDRAACTTAYDQGQRLRRQGALLESREQLLICGRDPCPESLQPDCVRWLGEVEHLVPSIVVTARRDDGTDIKDAHVLVDGQLRSEHLDGREIEMNPGDHKVRVEIGSEALEQSVVTTAAEKGRIVAFRLKPRVVVLPPPPPVVHTERPIGWPTYVLGGVGIVGIGLFAGFAIQGESRYSDLERCRPGCNPSDVDSARTSYHVSDVALGIGVLALAGAVVTYVLRPTVTTTSP